MFCVKQYTTASCMVDFLILSVHTCITSKTHRTIIVTEFHVNHQGTEGIATIGSCWLCKRFLTDSVELFKFVKGLGLGLSLKFHCHLRRSGCQLLKWPSVLPKVF